MKSIYVLNMKGTPNLSIRQRVIYARLAPLRRPVSAKRLAEMLGGLIDRQTISVHLSKLASLGLVRQSKEGWIALEPSGDMAKEFSRMKETPEDGRWQGCFASWRLPLPAEKPFPNARNKTELYCAYWIVRGLEMAEAKKPKPGRVMKVKRIAALLGVTKLTARKILMSLRDKGLFDKHKVFPHNFKLQEKDESNVKRSGRKAAADDADLLDVAVNRLTQADQIHAVIDQLTCGGYMLRCDICRVIEKALKEHKKNGYPGDGSPLVLDWLNAKLRTRQSRDDAGKQAVAESIALTVRRAEAVARLDREIAEESKTQKNIYEMVASKALPGENLKPMSLRVLYNMSELEAALPKLRDGMTKADICAIIRPPVKKAESSTVEVPCFAGDNALREQSEDFENMPADWFSTSMPEKTAIEPHHADLLAVLDGLGDLEEDVPQYLGMQDGQL